MERSQEIVGEPSFRPLPGRRETLAALDPMIPQMTNRIRTQMKGIAKVWQPADYLPSFENPRSALERIEEIQKQVRNLPPELLAVLVADAVTEEGLPLFLSRLFTLYGLPAGDTSDVFADGGNLQRWSREWAGEENRHGDLLSGALALTGAVNMKSYQQTIQLFLNDGLDPGIGNDPYKGFIYTSFQERATQISHANVAKLAAQSGNSFISEISGQIAADEGYHGRAYSEMVAFFFKRDPNGTMCALRDMWKQGIQMPAHLMREIDEHGDISRPGQTFEKFSDIAQGLGVYTAKDYARISAQLLKLWRVAQHRDQRWEALPFEGLDKEGSDAQKEILKRQAVFERVARAEREMGAMPDFSWLLQKHHG